MGRRAPRDLTDRHLGQLAERLRLPVGEADKLGGLVPKIFDRHAAPVLSPAARAGRHDGIVLDILPTLVGGDSRLTVRAAATPQHV